MTLILGLIMGVLYYVSYPNFFGINFSQVRHMFNTSRKTEDLVNTPQGQEVSVFVDSMGPIYGFPERFVVDSLGMDLEIVSVGVDEEGYLEAPKDWGVAGWYQKSSRPGETGVLLINAHYDDNYGRPAAFWKLKNINVGDKVSVLDSYNRTFNYEVVEIYHIGIDDPERMKVFEPFKDDTPVMTLITCGGVWSYADGTYDKRLVVHAELIQE